MDREQINEMLETGAITTEQHAQLIATLDENERLKARAIAGNDLRLKVSDKGGLSIYGLGRFPVTLYKSQWLRLFSHAQTIVEFLKDHDGEFAEKAPVTKAA